MAAAPRTNSTTPSSRTCSRSSTEPSFRSRTASRRQPRTSPYAHLHTGSVAVKVGDVALGPHLHFGLSDKPDFFSGRALPFVFDSFAMVGIVDFDASEADHVVMAPDSRQVGSA